MRNEEWNCPNNLEKNFLWLSSLRRAIEKQVEDEEEAEEKPDVQK